MKVACSVHADSVRFLTALAVAGAAIVLEPDFLVGPDVRAGRLMPILRRFESPPGNIYVAYPSRRNLSAKVRAFADFLSARFTAPHWAMETSRPAARRR
jgi:DNA-binding transcriptional LysR family regulator